MASTTKQIAEKLRVSAKEAREFCQQVQAHFDGEIPKFRVNASALADYGTSRVKPVNIAACLNETGWKNNPSPKFRVKPKVRKKRKKRRSNWGSSAKRKKSYRESTEAC